MICLSIRNYLQILFLFSFNSQKAISLVARTYISTKLVLQMKKLFTKPLCMLKNYWDTIIYQLIIYHGFSNLVHFSWTSIPPKSKYRLDALAVKYSEPANTFFMF